MSASEALCWSLAAFLLSWTTIMWWFLIRFVVGKDYCDECEQREPEHESAVSTEVSASTGVEVTPAPKGNLIHF